MAEIPLRRSTSRSRVGRRLRHRVYKRDGYTCWLCGEKVDLNVPHPAPDAATLDHVIRVKDGGPTTFENLRTAHKSCNMEREPHVHPVDFDEWPR